MKRSKGADDTSRYLTREAIVEAAAKIINAAGHESLTLRKLASDLGVSAGAIYSYVEDKEALLRAVIVKEMSALSERYEVLDIEDPVERIRTYTLEDIRWVRENPEIYRMMVAFPPRLLQPANFDLKRRPKNFGSKVFGPRAKAVSDAMEAGILREDDPYLINLMLFSAFLGVANLLLMDHALSPDFEARLAEAVIDSVIAGLRPDTRGVGSRTATQDKKTTNSPKRRQK